MIELTGFDAWSMLMEFFLIGLLAGWVLFFAMPLLKQKIKEKLTGKDLLHQILEVEASNSEYHRNDAEDKK